ncbi:MAG: hypothetical protein M1825_001271 [Sarcosagium campestre]|nr:MAG: hypothetical protein M1825_001271 [Sarcosagium campestre]
MGSSRQARIVAVKAPSAGASKSILATLEHEARILTYLHRLCNSKDYIVPFLGLDPESSSLVLASLPLTLSSFSETCGQQIRESYTTRKMYEPAVGTAQWLQLASHLIGGLQFLHSRLVIHGDIKPANILLRPSTGTDGTLYDPIYCDFSSAAVPDSPTPDLAITQAYTAPELLKAFMTPSTTPVPTAASDVFALGATLLMPAVGEELYASQPRPRKLAMAMEGRPLEMQASTSQGSRIMPGTVVARVLREAVAAKVDHRCSVGRWLEIFFEEAKDWTKK